MVAAAQGKSCVSSGSRSRAAKEAAANDLARPPPARRRADSAAARGSLARRSTKVRPARGRGGVGEEGREEEEVVGGRRTSRDPTLTRLSRAVVISCTIEPALHRPSPSPPSGCRDRVAEGGSRGGEAMMKSARLLACCGGACGVAQMLYGPIGVLVECGRVEARWSRWRRGEEELMRTRGWAAVDAGGPVAPARVRVSMSPYAGQSSGSGERYKQSEESRERDETTDAIRAFAPSLACLRGRFSLALLAWTMLSERRAAPVTARGGGETRTR